MLEVELLIELSGAAALLPLNEGSEIDGSDQPADFFGALLLALAHFNIIPLASLISIPS